MENLPPILIEQIFDELSIREAIHASYVSRQWRTLLSPYLYSTFSVNRLLSDFENPSSLLKMLRYTRSILCGQKLIGYFLPSCRSNDYSYPWDLHIPVRYEDIVHEELLEQGFVPCPRELSELERAYKMPLEKHYRSVDSDDDDDADIRVHLSYIPNRPPSEALSNDPTPSGGTV